MALIASLEVKIPKIKLLPQPESDEAKKAVGYKLRLFYCESGLNSNQSMKKIPLAKATPILNPK